MIINALPSWQRSIFLFLYTYIIMRRISITKPDLASEIKLSTTIIDDYCRGEKEPDPRNVMTLCIGLNLEKDYIYDMFAKLKNKYDINADTMQNRAYKFIINNGYVEHGLTECNKILRVFGQKPLPYHSKKKSK